VSGLPPVQARRSVATQEETAKNTLSRGVGVRDAPGVGDRAAGGRGEETVRDLIHRSDETGLACVVPRRAGVRSRRMPADDEIFVVATVIAQVGAVRGPGHLDGIGGMDGGV